MQIMSRRNSEKLNDSKVWLSMWTSTRNQSINKPMWMFWFKSICQSVVLMSRFIASMEWQKVCGLSRRNYFLTQRYAMLSLSRRILSKSIYSSMFACSLKSIHYIHFIHYVSFNTSILPNNIFYPQSLFWRLFFMALQILNYTQYLFIFIISS